jgi:electron transport complex protein RnfC
MIQHIGAPCVPSVKPGDIVNVGQVIGDSPAFVSAPIHATVVIDSDGEQTVSETVVKPQVHDAQSFVAAVRQSGLVGLGGAGFPTSVKLNVKDPTSIDQIIINSAECESYITSDLRTMLDQSDYIMRGVKAIREFLGIQKIVMGIEDNKPKAISLFRKLIENDPDFEIRVLPASYPQGGEKVLIYNITGEIVPEGKLPLDVGVVVINVTSLAFIGKYLETGMPLVEKCVTVDGSAIKNSQNVIVPIGTPLKEIAEYCGGYKEEPKKIIMGGPMMGITVPNSSVPLLKNNNAILFFGEKEAAPPIVSECIRCGRCARSCPLELMPADLERAYERKDAEATEKLKINLCMECGCCAYVCPAHRDLVFKMKLAKQFLRETKVKK